MQTVMIVGAGKGGTSILKILKETAMLDVKVVIDRDLEAEGIKHAKMNGIITDIDWRHYIETVDIIIEVTGDEKVFRELRDARSKNTVLIPGSVAFLVTMLIEEKEKLLDKVQNDAYKHDLIFNSTDDGMIVCLLYTSPSPRDS